MTAEISPESLSLSPGISTGSTCIPNPAKASAAPVIAACTCGSTAIPAVGLNPTRNPDTGPSKFM